MLKLFCWATGLMITHVTIPAIAKVQCSCPKVSAVGEGQTSCSTSESGGSCTVDFNLFGPESEKRAAELLIKYGKTTVTLPDSALGSDQALMSLSQSSRKELLDAILIYITVAAGNQSSRKPETVPLDSLSELVNDVRSDNLAGLIETNFNLQARKQWSEYKDEQLRTQTIQSKTVGRAIVSPGCVEFMTTTGLWMMFKTNWSPARITPRCGSPAR